MSTRYNAYIGWFGRARMWIGTGYVLLFALGLLGFVDNTLAGIRVNPAAHGWRVRAHVERMIHEWEN